MHACTRNRKCFDQLTNGDKRQNIERQPTDYRPTTGRLPTDDHA